MLKFMTNHNPRKEWVKNKMSILIILVREIVAVCNV